MRKAIRPTSPYFSNDASATVSDPVVTIEGFSFKSIGAAMAQKPTDIYDLDKLAIVEWKRDLDLADPASFKQELETPSDPAEAAIMTKLARVSLHYISDTVNAPYRGRCRAARMVPRQVLDLDENATTTRCP